MNEKLWISLWWTYTQLGFPPVQAGLHATNDEAAARRRTSRENRRRMFEETRRRRQEYVDAHRDEGYSFPPL